MKTERYEYCAPERFLDPTSPGTLKAEYVKYV